MDQEALVDDVTEGVADRLARNPSLRTPGFRSSFHLKGKGLSPPEAARALGVAYVVEGTVRKADGRVRIAARLIRADTGFVVWSQDFERPLADLAPAEDAIAAAVIARLARGAAST